MTKYLQERERKTRFVEFLRQLELMVEHDAADHVSRSTFCEISARIRQRIVAGCSDEEILDAISRCVPSYEPERLAMPDEVTPPQRPSSIDAAKRRDFWRGWRGAWGRAWWWPW